MKILNNGIKNARHTADYSLASENMDKIEAHFQVYIGVSYPLNNDLSLQLKVLVLICDYDNNCHIIDYCSHKTRVVLFDHSWEEKQWHSWTVLTWCLPS